MDKSDQKREEILDAAMLCLARYGIVKSTMDDIARVMGLKKASLYYYYKNKEAIFCDAMDREAKRFFSIVGERIRNVKTSADKIRILVKTLSELFRSKAELLEVNVQALVESHQLLHNMKSQMRKRDVDFLAQIIKEGVESGEFRRLDPIHVANALRLVLVTFRLDVFRSAAEQKLKEPDFDRMEEESLFIVDILLDGLKTK